MPNSQLRKSEIKNIVKIGICVAMMKTYTSQILVT